MFFSFIWFGALRASESNLDSLDLGRSFKVGVGSFLDWSLGTLTTIKNVPEVRCVRVGVSTLELSASESIERSAPHWQRAITFDHLEHVRLHTKLA